ncbi:MAG: SpoIIE family protein phosphatase [Anaerolineaceae bacterium]
MTATLPTKNQTKQQPLQHLIQEISVITEPDILWQTLDSFVRDQFSSSLSVHLVTALAPEGLALSGCSSDKADFHNAIESTSSLQQKYDAQNQEYLVGLPLLAKKNLLGSLILRRKEIEFTQAELFLLEGFVPAVSLAYQTILLDEQHSLQQKQLNLIASVTTQLAHITKLDALTREVCRLILDTFDYYYVAVFTNEPDSQSLLFRASARSPKSIQPPFEIPTGMKINLGEHIVGFVAQTGNTFLANDVTQEPRYGHLESLPETESELAIPMKIGNTVIGVLDVQSDQCEAFQQSDVLVLSVLADSIALALHRVRLYNDLEERTDQMDLIANVTKSISSILDLDQLLTKVLELIHLEFNYPYVHIFLVEYVQKKIEFKTGIGNRAGNYRKEAISFPLNAKMGIIPATVRSGKIQRIDDVSKDPRFLSDPFSGSVTGSELTIPLAFANEVFGVLDIQSDTINVFNNEDVELLSTLCASISIALRNAKLYNSEKWRRNVAESLQEVASLLSENVKLDQVLPIILSKIQDVLPCDLAAIWLLDETNGALLYPTQNQSMSLKAIRSNNPDFPAVSTIQVKPKDAWFFKALDAETPLIRSKSQLNDPFLEHYLFSSDFSAIAAPLVTGGVVQGVLTLHHHSANRYGRETQNISASFAGYTAVAIDNARLFQESQDQAWLSTILLQIAKATQSLTSIDELTALIGQMIMLLIGGKAGGIFLFDAEQKSFYIQSVFGDTFISLGLNLPFKVNQPDEFLQVADTQIPIALPAHAGDKALTSLLNLDPEDTILLLPLVAHNELLGVLMHVSTDPYQSETPEKVIGKQKFAILQGIAHQIAVSVQNINLLDARQEETYISSVLLQVSQTIVSTPNLIESLDKIYYTLHMLAGVEGCATFQLIPETDNYQLIHAISEQFHPWQLKSFIGKTFTTNDLPFLREQADGKPYIVNGETFLDSLNLLGQPMLTEEESSDAFSINPSNSAYIIFRLSMRGEDYGLLICRDPDLPKRERRLELLNGVAQQISFAFQNDRFEQARTEQERLDREFQLAREIQETFLPETLPKIDGYELDASWQTARQVGGDFYDAFEIRPGVFGLVIADVSDKGLAAALYMTVTRTLIRAVALEAISPARTLERVNELLQLDSKRGFFVTCVYAVLDQKRGTVLYCNAGHLPPIHINAGTNKVISLERGGIALGVMEEIHLEEHNLKLLPGDGLVLYTDGITEAYNKLGKFYGDKRYLSLLQKCINVSPTEIIQRVEADLVRFRRNAPLSDDVTQIVLRRQTLLTD